MRGVFKNPAVFHGVMAGSVLLGIKVILWLTDRWMFRLETFPIIAFFVIVFSLVFSGISARKRSKTISYGKALGNGMITIMIVVFISLLGDQIAYRSNPKFAEMTKEFELQQNVEMMNKVSFLY